MVRLDERATSSRGPPASQGGAPACGGAPGEVVGGARCLALISECLEISIIFHSPQMKLFKRLTRAPLLRLQAARPRTVSGGPAASAFNLFLLAAAAAALSRLVAAAEATVLPAACGGKLHGIGLGALRSPPAGEGATGGFLSPSQWRCPCQPSHRQRQLLAFLPLWPSSSQDFPESLFAGEWRIRGKLQDAAARVAASEAAEAVAAAGGSAAAAAFQRVWEALASGRLSSLVLSNNRLAAFRIPSWGGVLPPFSFEGIWQVRGRPFQPPLLEVEFSFPPEDPAVILILNAPLRAGAYLSGVPLLGEADASLSFSPFLPWKGRRLGRVDIQPKTNKPMVDILFN
ncbi:hypothetical protein Efla_000383 [Eimeria flavescens]